MRHRKFLRLASALQSTLVARGVLEMMWDSAYESGDDRLGSSSDLELVIGWTGETGVLTQALVAAGFVDRISDEDLRIHDLWHHAPDYVQKRRARELQRQSRCGPPNGAERRREDGDGRTPSPALAPALARAPKSVSSTPSDDDAKPVPADTSPAVLEFPTVGKGDTRWVLTLEQVQKWSALYPGVDVLTEARKALAWCEANPGRRKTAAGMPRFMVAWLGKEQDKGRSAPTVARQRFEPMRQPNYDSSDWWEECQRLHGGACEKSPFHAAKMAMEKAS